MRKKLSMILVLVVISLIFINGIALADDWPTSPMKIYVPFKAGGSADRLARQLAPRLEDELGVSVLVENYPGASTQIGTTMMLNSPGSEEGYNFMVSTQLYLSYSIITQNAPYSFEDLAFVNVEQFDPVDFTVHKDSDFDNFTELVEYIKENPGELSMGGIFGGSNYLTAMIIKEELDLDFNVVTYSSGAEYRNALLGKQVDFVTSSASGDVAIQDNAKVLTVALPEEKLPFPYWPDATSLNTELEKYDLQVTNLGAARFITFNSEFKENYPERWDKFVKAYENVVTSDEYREYLEETGQLAVTDYYGPEESAKMMEEIHATGEKYKDLLVR